MTDKGQGGCRGRTFPTAIIYTHAATAAAHGYSDKLDSTGRSSVMATKIRTCWSGASEGLPQHDLSEHDSSMRRPLHICMRR